MPSLLFGAFALAGVAAAAGPVVAHLMNRRRFRTVHWAAMDFLREAVRQSRRVLHLRDLLLLLLRVACVLLFGLAMARPFFPAANKRVELDAAALDGTRKQGAVHAVIAVDNSLSMGYLSLKGTLLDEGKEKCRKFIEALPDGSRVTIVPICDVHLAPLAPAAGKDAALRALDDIRPVDRTATLELALTKAEAALALAPELPEKRTILVSDGQRINFPTTGLTGGFEAARSDLQLVAVAPDKLVNTWVAELFAPDGVATAGAATPLVAVVRHDGATRRAGVQVTFFVDGEPMKTETVDMEPGQRREVVYLHSFPASASKEDRRFAVVGVRLNDDRLKADDARDLVLPVVDPLPIVYATEHGPTGERASTRNLWLRRLLAPADADDTEPKFVRIDDVPFALLTPKLLEEARLVVVADVRTPLDRVPLLREYVEQGGQLLIAAGEEFDARAWNDLAWLDGRGILPAPLKPEKIDVRTAATAMKPLTLASSSLGHRYFEIEGETPDALDALYSAPDFLQVVSAEPTTAAMERLVETEARRIAALRKAAERDADETPETTDDPAPAPPLLRLTWPEPRADRDHALSPEELAARGKSVVVGRYDNGLPLLVERKIDRGDVVFCSTGLQSSASTLTEVRAVVALDRLVREMLARTLPKRNFDAAARVVLPIRPQGSEIYLRMVRPDGTDEPLAVESLGDDKYALALNDLALRGTYRIAAHEIEADGGASERVVWELPLAVAGSESESELEPMPAEESARLLGEAGVRRITGDAPIRATAADDRAAGLWKWLMGLVLALLLAELLMIALMRPAAIRKPTEAVA